MSEQHQTTWTMGKLIAAIASIAAAMAIVPVYWTISDHWMNREEIKKEMKSHADNDARVQTWNQYGFAANRIDYLDDKQAECDIRKALGKLAPLEAAICSRYEAKLKIKTAEAMDLKSKAVDASKEK
jgi:hypothetical protein